DVGAPPTGTVASSLAPTRSAATWPPATSRHGTSSVPRPPTSSAWAGARAQAVRRDHACPVGADPRPQLDPPADDGVHAAERGRVRRAGDGGDRARLPELPGRGDDPRGRPAPLPV